VIKKILETLSLRSPRARLGFFLICTVLIFFTPYSFLDRAKLSLYERMHIASPSIGLTRAYWKILHGDFMGAWHRNKLIYIVLPIILGIVVNDTITYLWKQTSYVAPSK
jgi:hypothetical protein